MNYNLIKLYPSADQVSSRVKQMEDYAALAVLIEDQAAVISDEMLLNACSRGDVGTLRLLLTHWTSNPNSVIMDCIRHHNLDIFTAILEHERTKIEKEALILACELKKTGIICLILKDKRFDPTSVGEMCIFKLLEGSDSVEPLITLLYDTRLRKFVEYTLLELIQRDKVGMFEAVIGTFPYSSIALLNACRNNLELLKITIRYSRMEHKKHIFPFFLLDIEKLELIIQGTGRIIYSELLLTSIRGDADEAISLALKHIEDARCPDREEDECPLSLALKRRREDICCMLASRIGLVDCKHLPENSLLASQLGYTALLKAILPTLLSKKEEVSLKVITELLSSNHENKVLTLLGAGYEVSHRTLIRCLERGYYTTVWTVRVKQGIDLAWNDYELLRIAAKMKGEAYDSLLGK